MVFKVRAGQRLVFVREENALSAERPWVNCNAFVLGRYDVVPGSTVDQSEERVTEQGSRMDGNQHVERRPHPRERGALDRSGPKLASANKQMTNLDVFSQYQVPPVFKLGNRGYGAGRLALEIDRALEDRAYRFSMLLIQFDGLSEAIDRLGHANSDSVWGRILGVLTEDTGPTDLCCRLGGDEFMLVLSGRSESESRALAERLHRRWEGLPSMREAPLEMSIGLAVYPAQGSTVEGLFAAADQALHRHRAWPALRPSKEFRQRISP